MLETLSPVQAQTIVDSQPVVNYWQRFDLNQAPFDERTQYGMYYPLQQWQQLLQSLKQLSSSNQPLMVITGVLGSGKSTLVAQYMAQGDHQLPICLIRGHIALRVSNVLEQIDEAFKLSSVQKNADDMNSVSLLQLSEQLQNAQQRGVIVVDDAHRMPLETLSALIQLAADQASSYQKFYFVIVGETQLQNRVQNLLDILSVSLKPGFFELKPLALEETKTYLWHRLAKAGLSGNMPFTEAMVNRIQRLSGGVPGRINRVARQVLVELSTEINLPMQEISSWSKVSELFAAHKVRWISIGLLCALSIAGYWSLNHQNAHASNNSVRVSNWRDLWHWHKSLQATPVIQAQAQTTEPLTKASYHQQDMTQVANASAQTSAADKSFVNANQPPVTAQANTTSAMEMTDVEVNHTVAPAVAQDAAVVASTIADTYIAASNATATDILNYTNKNSMMTLPSTISRVLPPQPLAPLVAANTVTPVSVAVSNKQSTQITTDATNANAPVVIDENKNLVIQKPVASAPSAVVMQDNGEVLQPKIEQTQQQILNPPLPAKGTNKAAPAAKTQPNVSEATPVNKKGFTVQLYAANTLAMLQSFLKKHGSLMPMNYYKMNKQGKEYYVVVSGEFESSEAAKVAMQKMPATVKQLKPWIRPLSSLQEKVEIAS